MVDIDDTIIEVHGYAKQGAGLRLLRGPGPERAAGHGHHRGGRAGDRGPTAAQGIVRLAARRATAGRRRAGHRQAAAHRPGRRQGRWCGRTRRSTDTATVAAALRAGAEVSVTVRLDPKVKAAIAAIAEDAWTPDRVHRRDLRRSHRTLDLHAPRSPRSRSPRSPSQKKADQVPGRLVVRRIPDLNPATDPGRTPCSTPGGSTRSSPPPTPTCRHRGRGQDPPRPRDHRTGPRRPEELRPGPPALGEVHRQRRLAGPGGDGVQPHPRRRHPDRPPTLAKATTATIRRKLITVPARIASSARRLTLHLPAAWPWETRLDRAVHPACGPPPALRDLTTQPTRRDRSTSGTPEQRGPAHNHAHTTAALITPAKGRSSGQIGGSRLRAASSSRVRSFLVSAGWCWSGSFCSSARDCVIEV